MKAQYETKKVVCDTRGPGFESSHRHLLGNIYSLLPENKDLANLPRQIVRNRICVRNVMINFCLSCEIWPYLGTLSLPFMCKLK